MDSSYLLVAVGVFWMQTWTGTFDRWCCEVLVVMLNVMYAAGQCVCSSPTQLKRSAANWSVDRGSES